MSFIKTDRFQHLFKEGFWILLGQFLAILGSFVGVRLLTELLSPNEYGELALGTTLVVLVQQVFLGPLGNGSTRFYAPGQEKGELLSYFAAVRQMLLTYVGYIGLLVVVGAITLLAMEKSSWIPLMIVSFVFAVLGGGDSILNGMQNAARQRAIVALHQGMAVWARFFIASGLLFWLGRSSTIAMVGYAVAMVLVLCSQYHFFKKIIPLKDSVENQTSAVWRKKIWDFSWPFASWGIFTWAQLSSDRWALGAFAGKSDVGMYAVLYQLGYYPMSLLTGLCMRFISPIFFQRAGDASDPHRLQHVNKLVWYLTLSALVVTAIASICAFFLHGCIFGLFVAEKYRSISFLWPWVLLAGGIFAASQTVTLNIALQLKTQAMARAKIYTAILGIVLNAAGAYFFGVKGVVGAILVFSISIFLSMLLVLKRVQKLQS